MDNSFTFEADFPAGTKVLVYDGEDARGRIRTYPRTIRRTTHLMPPNDYLGRRILGFDFSHIFNNNERARIENERRLAWRRRPYDNNNPDPAPVPVRMGDGIPLGRVFVPQGGRKSRRGRKSKKSRKTHSKKRRSRRR